MGTLSEPLFRTVDITMPARLGFHLRVAARFVRRMREFRSTIWIHKGRNSADGKNILGLLLLAIAWKSKIQIAAVGDDAVQAIEGIREFFLNQENMGGDASKIIFLNESTKEGCET